MQLKNTLQLLAVLLFLPLTILAQKGNIRGSVIDDATGEALFGVTVVVKGTTNGSVTDFDGKFDLKLDPGTYDLQASFVSYKTITITGVTVSANEVTLIDGIRLAEDVAELEEVVITAEAINTTEAALLTVKRKSANVIDGISAANFRKIGDSDAASAAKRVTGVSVEGGKYVFVRGLGDRYTKTSLNNVDIPGLDPDRNSIQIDIFPTNLIDNMIVLKSFTADLPADFTGGIVNIETKDFPDEKIIDASFGVGINPSMHFNNNYLSYKGGETDFLGFDDGTRALPQTARLGALDIPSPLNGNATDQEVTNFLNEFTPTLGALNQTSFMNYNLGLTFADQITLKNGNKLGYIVTGSYKSSTVFYDEAFFGEYQKSANPDVTEMITATTQDGSVAEQNVLLGGLAGLAYKTDFSKFRLNFMRLQNGETRTAQFDIVDDPDGEATGKSGFLAISDNLEYNERSITNFFLNGEHVNSDASWNIDWRASATISTQDDPDIRKTAYTIINNDYIFSTGAAGNPSRLWRELDEINVVGKLDITREFEAFGNDAKLKFGASQVFKERDYEILQFSVRFDRNIPSGFWQGQASEVWTQENLYPSGAELYISSGNPDPNPNEYNSTVSNTGFYVSSELNPSEKLKTVIGLRAENYVQEHTGRDISGENVLDGERVLDSFDLFPSVNLIYGLNESQNLRVSYSKTIARPSFKELSFAQILDPVSNRIFNGGLFEFEGSWDGNLRETDINNFDIRWEKFMDGGQLFSISGFYKTFANPIELVRIPQATTNNEFQPRNVGDGRVVGIELELRKNLEFISPRLSNWSLNGNFTYVESSVEMTDTEFVSRENFLKTGESLENTRDMAGQAPWIVNLGIQYENFGNGLDAGLFYNVKGETLTVVGGGLFPDVYSEPFHSLNFNLNKSLGLDNRTSINFSIENILNDVREEFYQSYNSTDQLFTSFNPGMTIGLGINHSF